MSQSIQSIRPKLRLWILKDSLYPARVTIYLEEKGIKDDFELIPVNVDHKGAAPTPGKPPGSVPILEIKRSTSDDKLDGQYIYQSSAILEYLEDVYAGVKPDMRGKTAEERARVRDCMNILNEAVIHMESYWHNSSALFEGMEPQEDVTALWALDKYHKTLKKLESLADPIGPFLATANGQPTIVDCVLLAAYLFGKDVYADDIVAEHPRLAVCAKAFEGRAGSSGGGVVSGLSDEVKEKARSLRVRRG